jgi:hypothetical protein
MSEQAGRQMKRPWREPQLIVVVRGKGEESVLVACKGDKKPTSFIHHFAGCHMDIDCTNWCSGQSTS